VIIKLYGPWHNPVGVNPEGPFHEIVCTPEPPLGTTVIVPLQSPVHIGLVKVTVGLGRFGGPG
jgi:hypothetical protein